MDEVELVLVGSNPSQVLVNAFFEIDERSSNTGVVKSIFGNEDTAVIDVLDIEQVAVLKVVSHCCVPYHELIPGWHLVHIIAK